MDGNLVFRNDDVNFNTNKKSLASIYGVIHSIFPNAEIWSGITLFSQKNDKGSIYETTPFKNNNNSWFYSNADSFMHDYRHPLYKIASHGLYHIDHSKVSRETQEMSILGSCGYLKTNKFIPPFNKYNQDTLDICFDNNIDIKVEGWKSIEHEKFTPEHKYWYFHSWRFTPNQLKEVLGKDVLCDKNS